MSKYERELMLKYLTKIDISTKEPRHIIVKYIEIMSVVYA